MVGSGHGAWSIPQLLDQRDSEILTGAYVWSVRSEWIPLSAAALVTGAMALVLGSVLDPTSPSSGPAATLQVAAENSGRWLAMSVLFFCSAVGLILGMPALLSLFTVRARRLGLLAVAVFSLGAIGITGFSALMLVARALALKEAIVPNLLDEVLEDSGLRVMLTVWMIGFSGGILLIAIALLRARSTPRWVPGLLLLSLTLSFVPGTGRVGEAVAMLALAAGFTGIATAATSPGRRAELHGAWVGSN